MFNQDDSRAGKAAFRFCSECDNMLYPREDRATRRLLYGCRHCNHVEEADSTCVYQHIVSAQAKEQTLGSKDLANDPTFPRASKTCPKCGYHECVFFQSRSKHRDATMKLRYVCSNTQCGHRWTD
ncbi:DNA directed RNA polymerase II polypeptide I [Phlyctochytrium arcticum]|nr:DNA directed RNA polymerase II polypeptide I [Phlyctochytrium arcticum]